VNPHVAPLAFAIIVTIRGVGRQGNIPLLLRLNVFDKQARLQNVIVRLADVWLINFFEPMNQRAQIRQNLPVICIARFRKYIQSHLEVGQCDLDFTVVRTSLWAIVHALQSANGKLYQIDSLDSLSVVHPAF
jgi:hypothetical protein